MRLASVNADPGIAPGRPKGAAVHLAEVRAAFVECGAEVLPLDEPDPERLRAALALAHERAPLDLVYERYALGATGASEFCRARGIPHVLEVNAPLALEARRFRPEQQLAVDPEGERALFAGAELVLAVSRGVARFACEQGAEPARVRVAANAVDPRRFRPLGETERAELRATLGLANGHAFVLGFHGRPRPWHNLRLLFRAATRLREVGIDARVLAVGQGDFAASMGREFDRASFVHHPWTDRDRIGALVACFDVLPLTYAPDPDFYFSPLKLLEAMAAGVPAVVPAVGDLEQWVASRSEGLVVPPGDEDALTAALVELWSRPDERRAMGRAAAARARRHTWAEFARGVLCVARGARGARTP